MVNCPKCNERVNNALLRADTPTCQNGHALGRWTRCENATEPHAYLSLDGANCPYCAAAPMSRVEEASKVKCLHQTSDGALCQTRAFLWMTEGPPCFMNHVGKMKLV